MPTSSNSRKRRAARKLYKWRHSAKPPRLATEKHWRNRIAKKRMPKKRPWGNVVIFEPVGSSMMNLETFEKIWLSDWKETSTYSTVEI